MKVSTNACKRKLMLRNCCCCCDVKVGATVVGALWIMITLLEIIPFIAMVIASTFMAMNVEDDYEGYDSHHGSHSGEDKSWEHDNDGDDGGSSLYVACIVIFIIALLIKGNTTLSSIGLLFGIKSKNIGLFLWWLVSAVIQIIVDSIGLICVLVVVGKFGGCFAVVFAMIPVTLITYFHAHSYLCVLSHYQAEKRSCVSISFIPETKDDILKLKYAADGVCHPGGRCDVPPPPAYPALYHDTDTAPAA